MTTERKNKRLHIVTTAYERQQIEQMSDQLGMTVSQLVRLAAQQFITNHAAAK
ncbi:plasmid mobilization protein [Synechocystis sp. PCC 7509]|uniref:plasmid mobilization protein n=1 Tax=Synechocystis sp. PCC 7509 TaxID=927677 RepID=UPI0002ABDA26|nr:Ribbon-helix-helix protein, copG family [Synechocystis sp. PCC 7509]